MEETTQEYPVFYNAGSKAAWTSLNNQANELLGFSNEGADSYSNPIIDKYGKYWFIVNPEVSSLVDLTKCSTYDLIQFPESLL